jgi:transposase-like protein
MSSDDPFKWRHFQADVILWAVRWYCKYPISYRDLEEMLAERGIQIDHTTLYRWVQRYAPEMEQRLRRVWKPCFSRTWHVDETYIKIKGKWVYLYRAIDQQGRTIDFYLSQTRNAKAAKRFLGKALRCVRQWERPATINTDKAYAYGIAIKALKQEGLCPQDTQHRYCKYLNNIIEGDHARIKQLIRPTLGFKSMKTAYATIKGFELMRAIRKGQTASSQIQNGVKVEVRLIERAFGIGKTALEDVIEQIQEILAHNPELEHQINQQWCKTETA